jgi:hypothetical protein
VLFLVQTYSQETITSDITDLAVAAVGQNRTIRGIVTARATANAPGQDYTISITIGPFDGGWVSDDDDLLVLPSCETDQSVPCRGDC